MRARVHKDRFETKADQQRSPQAHRTTVKLSFSESSRASGADSVSHHSLDGRSTCHAVVGRSRDGKAGECAPMPP